MGHLARANETYDAASRSGTTWNMTVSDPRTSQPTLNDSARFEATQVAVHGPEYSFGEELVNAITHGAGLIAAVAAGAVLITLVALSADPWRITSASVYVAALVLLLTASTLYHAIPQPRAKAALKVLDHCAIFILIAGTYTPFTLVGLKGTWGWTLFALIWSLALTGVVFKLFFTGRFKGLSTALFLAMGWLVVIAAKPMLQQVPMPVLYWLLAGGIAYSLGTLFYLAKRLRFAHAVWHGFVLVGCGCHFVAVSGLLL